MVSVSWVSRLDSIVQLIDVDGIVSCLINNWHNIAEFQHLDVVCCKHIFELLRCDSTLVLVVEKVEALLHIEGLMTEQNLFSDLYLPLVL